MDPNYLDDRGYIKVDHTFKVNGLDDVYAGGDVAAIVEEKLAQNAEAHADVIAHNLLYDRPSRYVTSERWGVIVSLGTKDGVFYLHGFWVAGFVAALMKCAVEMKVLAEYRNRRALWPSFG